MQSNDNQLQKKEEELQSYRDKLSEYTKQIGSFELTVSERMETISYLENIIKMKDAEGKQANSLIEKIKSMSSENCQELQLQIDSVSFGQFLFVIITQVIQPSLGKRIDNHFIIINVGRKLYISRTLRLLPW